jgi:hypothetical protein
MHVFDDFREAYSWLRHNTPEDAKVHCDAAMSALVVLLAQWTMLSVGKSDL